MKRFVVIFLLLLTVVGSAKVTCGACYGSGKCQICRGSGKEAGQSCYTCSGSGACYPCSGAG